MTSTVIGLISGAGPGGGPVGFQPQITTLPAGAFLGGSGALAVVHADRRYVRVAPLPFFSQIGEVSTFDFGGGPAGWVTRRRRR